MSKKCCAIFGALFLFATTPPAYAVTYTLQFMISGFGVGAPADPVSGTIVFDKSDSDYSIDSLISVDLTIAVDVYNAGNSLIGNNTTLAVVGSNYPGGPNLIDNFDGAHSDFRIRWSKADGSPDDFFYTTSNNGSLWGGDETAIEFTSFVFTEGDLSAIPIPAALPLFASGLGVMGLIGWHRRRKKATALAA